MLIIILCEPLSRAKHGDHETMLFEKGYWLCVHRFHNARAFFNFNRSSSTLRRLAEQYRIEIAKIEYKGKDEVCVATSMHMFWIRILQRRWKWKFAKRKEYIQKMKNINHLWRRQFRSF
jgi:hypothetical protein